MQVSEGLWLMNKAAHLQLEHFNKSNALSWAITMGLFAMPGAAIALLGPAVGIPRIGPLDPEMASMALGAGVTLLGILFGRARAAWVKSSCSSAQTP